MAYMNTQDPLRECNEGLDIRLGIPSLHPAIPQGTRPHSLHIPILWATCVQRGDVSKTREVGRLKPSEHEL